MANHVRQTGNGTQLLEAYRLMLGSLFLAAIVIMALIAAAAIGMRFFAAADGTLMTLFVVSMAGTLGALFSALSRLYAFEELPKALLHPDLQRLRNRYLAMYSLIPPLIGAVASVVIYMAFAAGYLQGQLFPNFTCKVSDCSSLGGLFSYGPNTASDYARTLIWGFTSGFSERVVRDVLQRYVDTQKA